MKNLRDNLFIQSFKVCKKELLQCGGLNSNPKFSGQLNPKTRTWEKGWTLFGFQFLFFVFFKIHIQFSHKWELVAWFLVKASLKVIPWGDQTGMLGWCPKIFVISTQHW
jgi:hypothetical protein